MEWGARRRGKRGKSEDGAKKVRRLLQSPLGRLTTTAAVIGEDMADKLPKTPARIRPGSFISRIIIGASSGIELCRRAHRPRVIGAVIGAVSAGISTIAMYSIRKLLSRTTKVPDPIWGSIEDIL